MIPYLAILPIPVTRLGWEIVALSHFENNSDFKDGGAIEDAAKSPTTGKQVFAFLLFNVYKKKYIYIYI